MSAHPYVDNACAHAVHDDCPSLCPYCHAPCACGCHREAREAAARALRPPATPAEPVPAVSSVPRRFPPTAPRTGQLDPVGTYRG